MDEEAVEGSGLNELYSHVIDLKLKMGRSSVTEEKILSQGGNIASAYTIHFMEKYANPIGELLKQAQEFAIKASERYVNK